MSADDTGLEIAVVGMAGRFPGAANVDELWRGVREGREAISFLTPEELSAAGVPAEESRHPDYVPAYGVVDDVDLFDADFFGYSPRDARLLDPQQRLLLECAWEALEGAGHLADGSDELVGVYVASSMSTYLLRNLINNRPLLESVSEYELLLANDKDAIATRVAYHLDLCGPAVCVQTACSSSLVAIHLAFQGLLAQDCDVAIAGGAHVRVPTAAGYRYEDGGIMSRDGHCRPFEAGATGTIGGNGAATVVLRRLTDAIRDGDTIYAVVKGSAINNDGGVKIGYTAPSVDGQASVIRMAQDAAEVDASTIGYVETHGTATSLGDQIEFQALVESFRAATQASGYCALGALKSLIGHLDAAAGVAGFIKAALSLRHGVIPPSSYFDQPHPALDFADSPFYVNAEARSWPQLGGPRRAAVSSFGIGGTNAHVVLQEAPATASQPSTRRDQLVVLSARTPEALGDMREQLATHLRRDDDVSLADVAYTLQATRRAFPHRLALVCGDAAEAAGALADDASPLVRTAIADRADRTVAFVFPGQGAQYLEMAGDLYRTEPVFRRCFDECAAILAARLDVDLHEAVYPATGDAEQAAARLQQTALAQPALFAVEYALAQLWREWGVQPAALAGHSIGEYVAACLAGVFSLDDALTAVAIRGRLMQAMPPGAMLSVQLPAGELESSLPADVTLAAANAPQLSVVSGGADAIAVLEEQLRARQIECRLLHTSHAFHSAAMDPVLEPFTDHLSQLTLRPPQIPIVSNLTGSWLTPEDATDPSYWTRQLREPVRFSEASALLLEQDHAVLEVGPGTTLATLTRQHPSAPGKTIVSSLSHPSRRVPDGAAMADALGRLWTAGVAVDWQGMWANERRQRSALPTYPFQRRRHWIDPVEAPAAAATTGVVDAATEETLDDTPASEEQPVTVAAPPASAPEETIRRIWIELLGVEDVGPHDNFFELGGHSLLGTKVIARIRDALSFELPASALFESPTIAELAAAVEHALAAPDARAAEPAPGAANGTAPDATAAAADAAAVEGNQPMPDDVLAAIVAMSPEEVREQLAAEKRASVGLDLQADAQTATHEEERT